MKRTIESASGGFGDIFLIIYIIICVIVLYVLKQNRKDVKSSNVQYNVLLLISPIVCLPIWIDPVSSYLAKLISTALAVTGANIYYFAGDRIAEKIRRILGRTHDRTNS